VSGKVPRVSFASTFYTTSYDATEAPPAYFFDPALGNFKCIDVTLAQMERVLFALFAEGHTTDHTTLIEQD